MNTPALKAVTVDAKVIEAKRIIVDELVNSDGQSFGGSDIKITSPHALGDFYFSLTSYMPEGVVPLNGSEISRVVYSDLYEYVQNIHNELTTQNKKFLISEEEWQNISIENNGYVPYYSHGSSDGMFRVPRMSGYIKATGEINEAGEYIAEGLPNITTGNSWVVSLNGTSSSPVDSSSTTREGCLTDAVWSNVQGHSSNNYSFPWSRLDASRSSAIYGNSEHVTPETNTLFVGVWALNAFTQVGTANLEEIKEILSQCETILGDSLPLLSSRYDSRGLETSAWKLSDGSWLDGRIYTDAYNKILQRVSEGDTVCLEMKESELLSSTEFPENFLIDIEGIKFRLPLFVTGERVVVKDFREGTEWYRIYSDGYIEQGGEINGTVVEDVIVNLLVPFINTEYTVLKNTGINGVYTENITGRTVSTWNYTTTSFTARTSSGTGLTKLRWYAFGQGETLNISDWDGRNYFKVSHGVDEGKINIEEKLTEFEETAYTRLDEVVEEVSKDYVVHVDKTVGELYFSFNDYFPDGVIPLDGRLVSRATYADLWEWVQEKGLVKDDTLITINNENTVSIFNEDGTIRYCPWYGTGDGSLTFRMPKINGYGKLTGDNTFAGQYIQEGLPNITGRSGAYENLGSYYLTSSGALKTIHAGNTTIGGGGTGAYYYSDLDASRSNSIYGNSEHVTPETNTLFVGVWAITAAKAAVFDMRDIEEILKSSESLIMNNVPLMSSRWDRDGLGNLGWVKADGSWVDGRTYVSAYNYCVEKLIAGDDDFVDGQIAVITSDNCSKFIVDRINKRFRLPITNSSRELVASYKEGTQWYNIYSDGWVEQGGEYYNNSDTVVKINLLVPYKDTSYTVDKVIGIDGSYTSQYSACYHSTWSYTTSSFSARTYGSAGLNRFRWFAKGYGEILSTSSPERTIQLYFKLAHEFYVPAEASIQEKLDIIDNLASKVDINLPTLSSRWDSDFAENLGWVKSEGQWLNGNIYRDAYDMMVARIGINDKFISSIVGTELTSENADKFLIDTAAVKFRLPLVNGERTLVVSYKDGARWYNWYSDGYIEQGDLATASSVTYLVPMLTTDYSILTGHVGSNSTTSYEHGAINSRTQTGFSWAVYDSFKLMYKVSGFASEPTITDYNCGTYLYFKLGDAVPSTVVDTQSIIDDLHQKCNDYQDTMDAILALGSDYICGCMIPDYTTGIDLTSNVETVMPYHAWIYCLVTNSSGSGWAQSILTVNGIRVGVASVTTNSNDTCTIFAKKGDIVKIENQGENGTRAYINQYYRLSGASAE